ncbi:Gfo/Idh/MocA family protein [Bradyrhizobium erythrophlei]|uniref:Predicted dehydrogenase n=1 Tax=Bradyrhizobium erythrophlei TaxID=1437360 RepID=A0A1M5PBM9_9BRAD|nr:Gfo/Idh/MocA family oxidoreductase [Bradyrhizobium erythrophlei]SHG99188.1 Predicted dehydrogenase [Bradyrhizobium erythrophlei]
MGKLTGVLIGCGAIAREHLLVLPELNNVEIVAVCDISDARAEASAERFGIAKWYTSHRELLADLQPDLVHITTPPASHFPIAQDCLAAGRNVFCEKPITIRYSDFGALKQLARDKGSMLMENQQFRFHSSIQRIEELVRSGELGEVIEMQICLSLNITGAGSPYVDQNAPHFGLTLSGGVIGDFLPHIAYLVYMFTGKVIDVHTGWFKHKSDSPLPADEFRGLIKGERTTAYVSFSGNAQPDGFLIRVVGTRMRVEANLFEPPRLIIKRSRSGEPAVMTLVDGIAESRQVLAGSVVGFLRKLGGTSSYDGLKEMISRTYRAIELREPQPIPLDEIDAVARLVEQLAATENS